MTSFVMQLFQNISEEAYKVTFHLLPALVTVGLGGCLLQRFFVGKANEASLIDRVISDMDMLLDDAIEYWNIIPDSDENMKRDRILSQKIKGRIRCADVLLQHYSSRYKDMQSNLRSLMMDVSEACTGGQFESATRREDIPRFLKIYNSINQVKIELLRRKL